MIRMRVDVQSCTPDFIRMIQAPNIYAYSFCKEQGVVHDQNTTKQNKTKRGIISGSVLNSCPVERETKKGLKHPRQVSLDAQKWTTQL